MHMDMDMYTRKFLLSRICITYLYFPRPVLYTPSEFPCSQYNLTRYISPALRSYIIRQTLVLLKCEITIPTLTCWSANLSRSLSERVQLYVKRERDRRAEEKVSHPLMQRLGDPEPHPSTS